MLEIQGDVFLFGGYDANDGVPLGYKSAIYQLSCSSGICSWATLNQALTVGRSHTVAIPVPDSFCFEEGDGTTHTGSGGTTLLLPTISTTSGGCSQGWIGDGYCDDINNNVGCNFDSGDCCGSNVNTQYCTECLCLE